MIHMNMQVMPRVFFAEVSNHGPGPSAPSRRAARKAAMAPMAELSTSEVQPLTKGTIIVEKMPNGKKPRQQQPVFLGLRDIVAPPSAAPGRAWGSAGSGWRCEDEHGSHHQPRPRGRQARAAPTGWRAIMRRRSTQAPDRGPGTRIPERRPALDHARDHQLVVV